MKTKIYLATADGLNVIEGSKGTWRGEVRLQGQPVECVAVDSSSKGRVYCGTFGNGVFRSDNAGASWLPCQSLRNQNITVLATADSGDADRPALLYAGTEPSAIYQSSDGGDLAPFTWLAELDFGRGVEFPAPPGNPSRATDTLGSLLSPATARGDRSRSLASQRRQWRDLARPRSSRPPGHAYACGTPERAEPPLLGGRRWLF